MTLEQEIIEKHTEKQLKAQESLDSRLKHKVEIDTIMSGSNRYPAIHTKHLLGASNSTILEEDLPGVFLANSPSVHSSNLQSIPHRSDQLNFSLNGDTMRLGDP